MEGVKTTCPYCGVGCGIIATPTAPRIATIKGDPEHPANFGRLCSKGTHLGETVGLEGRLLYPEIAGKRAGWDEALDLVAKRFKDTIAEHGRDSVAFYVSGQLLTEDYYVANKLMKGFIGSGNIDTNSRLCMSSAVTAHIRAFGEDIVPCSYEDMEEADLIILVGSNTAWCHPVVWQRIEAAREKRGTKLVVIDPRKTETAERADLHLAIAPDTDVALFNGLLHEMRDTWQLDGRYLADHIHVPAGFWELPKLDVAKVCDIPASDLQAFYDLFAAHPRTVTLFSQGVNQSTSGTDKGNAIINVHLATGRIGKRGAGPFSITGQPNAMGGREVGGLASTLAAHMGFSLEERDKAQRFWQSPTVCAGPGLKAVDMFDAAAVGKIRALWIIATNPAVSMPDARKVRVALANCPFVVVSDCIAQTDTMTYANVKLPALAWGEKDGTVTNSERRISRQRPFMGAPGEAKPDWWALSHVARKMGFAGFDYAHPAEIFREFSAMTAFENEGARLLNLRDLASVSDMDYAALSPTQWGGASPFGPGHYPTRSGKAEIVPVKYQPPNAQSRGFPLTLNTGRYRDQWHTMTRTGLSPKLSQHRREPMVEVHPDTIQRRGLTDGGLARVNTATGSSVYRVQSAEGQRRRELFVPIHWTDQTSAEGRTGLLPSQARDPHSGQPGFKNTPATIASVHTDWTGFLITRDAPVTPDCLYWTRMRVDGGWLTEVAGVGDPASMLSLLPSGDLAEVHDMRRRVIRAAIIEDDKLVAALFINGTDRHLPRAWLISQLAGKAAHSIELLAGRPATPTPDRGPIICVCFDIGLNTILAAIRDQKLTSVATIGFALGAGTNCGSCRPELAKTLVNAIGK